jgi:hypothetical protein
LLFVSVWGSVLALEKALVFGSLGTSSGRRVPGRDDDVALPAEPGRRRVPDLPPGSRVRLGERADAPVVTLDRPGETVVRWPPR